jgi:hypothetical protein
MRPATEAAGSSRIWSISVIAPEACKFDLGASRSSFKVRSSCLSAEGTVRSLNLDRKGA